VVSIFKFPHRLRSSLSLVFASLTFTFGNVLAEEMGSPSQGLTIARRGCAECHLVDKLPEQSPNVLAPTFEHIANIPGMNSTALTVALRTSHESMPNIIIKDSDLSDVIAYILSLRKSR
jgi:mono/diheme cytochrome c family protein